MYSLFLKKEAKDFLKKLDKKQSKRIIKKIELLKENPYLGIPLMGNFKGLRKLRIGDYRTMYKIIDEKLIVVIIKFGHRKNIYK